MRTLCGEPAPQTSVCFSAMNQIRFTIALAILLLILMIYRFIMQPYGLGNILIPFGESVGLIIVGLIWGVLIYLPIRLFKGPDNSPDFQSYIVYVAFAFAALYMIYKFIR